VAKYKKSPTGTDRASCLSEKSSGRDNAYRFLVQWTLVPELDAAIYLCIQGVVSPDTDVIAGMNLGATLADDDISGRHKLTAKPLDAKPLGIRVAPVT
jgi:hypothetical protein